MANYTTAAHTAEKTRKIAGYKLRIDSLINTMTKDNVEVNQRQISVLKMKIMALQGCKDPAMDWGISLAEGTKI